MLIDSKARSGTQELSYAPGDEFLHFVIDLNSKKDATSGEAAIISPVVEASHVTSGVAALNLDTTSSVDTNAPRQAVVCFYCRKPGQTDNKCYALRREKKKTGDRAEQIGVILLLLPSTSLTNTSDRYQLTQPSVLSNGVTLTQLYHTHQGVMVRKEATPAATYMRPTVTQLKTA